MLTNNFEIIWLVFSLYRICSALEPDNVESSADSMTGWEAFM